MKKYIYQLLFTIIMLHIHVSLLSMLPMKRVSQGRRSLPRGTTATPPRNIISGQRLSTKTSAAQAQRISPPSLQQKTHFSQQPSSTTLFAQFQNRIRQWLFGKTAQDIIKEIREGKPTAMSSFVAFVKQNIQADVDMLLDLLLIIDIPNNDAEIEILGEYIGMLIMEEKPNLPVLEKLAGWALFRYMDLLKRKAPATIKDLYEKENIADIFVYLIGFDEHSTLSSEILKNLEQVCHTTNGLLLIRGLFETGNKLSSEKYGFNQHRAGERMLGVWKDITNAIEKDLEKFSPLLNKTIEGKEIISIDNGQLSHKPLITFDQTIKK